jgi:hypothetical protein
MRNHPDPLPAQADIAAVVAETGLSLELVTRIHEHLTEIQEKPPTYEDLEVYAAYGAEHLGEGGIRHYLEMSADPDHPATPEALRLLEQWAAEAEAWSKPPRTWTGSAFALRYVDACIRTTPPYTPRSVAPDFIALDRTHGISPDHLRRLIRRFGLPRRVEHRTTTDRG